MPKKTTLPPPDDRGDDPLSKVYKALERFISNVPTTDEHKSKDPVARARSIANAAAAKAALVSGGLALPPGPLGFATVLPDLITIWRIQAQMVADIAGTFDKTAFLTREQMLYCLFKHVAAQFVRDLVVRVGERFLVRRVSLRAVQQIIQKIVGRITQRVIGKAISRWLPLVGAVGVGAYAYYDTARVGKTAIELFQRELEVEHDSDGDKAIFTIYVGDSSDVVRRIRVDHCGKSTNVEASSLREHLAENVGYRIIKSRRPGGSVRKRLDLPDPGVAERLISSYIKSGVWRFIICDSAQEANDFQWYAIEQLKPLLNIKRKHWKAEHLARYRSLLATLLSSPSLKHDQLDNTQSGPGVYVLYHESQPKNFIVADRGAA